MRAAGTSKALLAASAITIACAVIVVGATLVANGRSLSVAIGSGGSSVPAATIEAIASPSPEFSLVPSPSPSPNPTPNPTPSPLPTPTATYPPLAAGVVPILYLHRVQATPPDWATLTPQQQKTFLAYDVIPQAFEAQLDWLQSHGYTTILPRDLASHWDRGTPLPPRPVIISLDDGFESWTQLVLPLLKARHMVAEFYLTIDAIKNFQISWNQVRELARAGMGIGAHDVHHVQLTAIGPNTPPYPASVMWYEVNQARIIIGREIGIPPDSMAYVGGGFDATLIRLVRLAGYTTARSVIESIHQSRANRFTLRVVRIGVMDDVLDVVTGHIRPGLPLFSEKMAGLRI